MIKALEFFYTVVIIGVSFALIVIFAWFVIGMMVNFWKIYVRDSLVKKVVVFLLSKTKKYDARTLGHKYQISYLYVPTVIVEVEYLVKTVPGFEVKINNVYERIGFENQEKARSA